MIGEAGKARPGQLKSPVIVYTHPLSQTSYLPLITRDDDDDDDDDDMLDCWTAGP